MENHRKTRISRGKKYRKVTWKNLSLEGKSLYTCVRGTALFAMKLSGNIWWDTDRGNRKSYRNCLHPPMSSNMAAWEIQNLN